MSITAFDLHPEKLSIVFAARRHFDRLRQTHWRCGRPGLQFVQQIPLPFHALQLPGPKSQQYCGTDESRYAE